MFLQVKVKECDQSRGDWSQSRTIPLSAVSYVHVQEKSALDGLMTAESVGAVGYVQIITDVLLCYSALCMST